MAYAHTRSRRFFAESTRLTADGSFYCARWRALSCRLSSANYFGLIAARDLVRAVALEQRWKKTYRSRLYGEKRKKEKRKKKNGGTTVSTFRSPVSRSRNLEKKLSLLELIKGK